MVMVDASLALNIINHLNRVFFLFFLIPTTWGPIFYSALRRRYAASSHKHIVANAKRTKARRYVDTLSSFHEPNQQSSDSEASPGHEKKEKYLLKTQ